MPVVNLSALNTSITMKAVMDALEQAFQAHYDQSAEVAQVQDVLSDEMERLINKYQSWEWQFGHTPPFTIEFSGERIGIDDPIKIRVERGCVCAEEDNPISLCLSGHRFASGEMADSIRTSNSSWSSLADWIDAQAF